MNSTTNWEDNTFASPPKQYDAVAATDQYWWAPLFGQPFMEGLGNIAWIGGAIPNTFTINYNCTVPPEEGTNIYLTLYNTAFGGIGQQQQITATGTGSMTITNGSSYSGYMAVGFTHIGGPHGSYDAVVALSFAGPIIPNIPGSGTGTVGGQGDITDPGAWEDGNGLIPPLAYQNVPQTVNYPLNGDGRYWFAASAYAPTPTPIGFIGDPSFLVDTMGLQWSITQKATDGSELFLSYSINNGTTFTAVQIGGSLQDNSLLSGLVTVALAGATIPIVEVYANGGTANVNAVPWNVAVAITRNTNEKLAWDAPNPYNPVSYNCECMDEVVPTSTLLQLRTRITNRLGFKALLAEVNGQTLGSMQTTLMQRIGFSNQSANPPPGMAPLMVTIINEAQQTLYNRYAQDGYSDTAPPILVNPSDTITLNNIAVQLLAVALGKMHYGQSDGAQMMKSFETYLAELYKRSPPNLTALLNDFIISAQTFLYRRYSQLHTRRMFRWKVSPGQRFYSLKDNDEDVLCNFQMDPLKQIEWAGIQDSRNVWYPLIEGIEPQLYTMIDKPWRPARYEIRQCIEIYPAPDQTYWMWFKAHFGLMTFAADTDSTTIDSELVFLHALANAKAHFGQPDAQNVEAMANTYRKELIAGTHGTNKYIPGTVMVPPAIRPSLIQFDGNPGG